jgi:hypothetical protein
MEHILSKDVTTLLHRYLLDDLSNPNTTLEIHNAFIEYIMTKSQIGKAKRRRFGVSEINLSYFSIGSDV